MPLKICLDYDWLVSEMEGSFVRFMGDQRVVLGEPLFSQDNIVGRKRAYREVEGF
jgi:hypothetical protein